MERFDSLITDHLRRQVDDVLQDAAAESVVVGEEDVRRILRFCGACPFAVRILQQQPEGIPTILAPREPTRRRRRIVLQERLPRAVPSPVEELDTLRRAHRLEGARIALHHLEYRDDILGLTEDLSDIADIVLERVFSITERMLEEDRGPKPADGAMAVFSLGKLGGEELNFSSDIDLMFVYRAENDSDRTAKWFERQAAQLGNVLQATTPYGFFYRVDTRLRPEGSRGALTPSFLAVETYYHTFGEAWERQALLKLRPVAGDASLRNDVARVLEPFTYRKYIDEVEIADTLRGMDKLRRRMGENYKSCAERERDIKVRRGGIRDVEFITQAIQILYGGQYPEVRVPGTVIALRRMFESGLMHSADHETLMDGYQKLRLVEHALQLREGRQTYLLPSDAEELNRVAWIAGYDDSTALLKSLDEIARRVHDVYVAIFGRTEWEDRTSILVEESTSIENAQEVLREYGIQDVKAAQKRLQRFTTDPEHTYLQAKTKRRFLAILPRLLTYASEQPNPDRCLQQLERILDGVGSRSAFYDTMKDRPQVIQLLTAIAGGSEFLTETLRRDPALVESLGNAAYLRDGLTPGDLRTYANELDLAYPKEDIVERLVRLRNGVGMRLGVRFLLQLTEVDEIARELTTLAEFVLERLYETARPSLSIGTDDDLLIVGLGKLGGYELNFASDLDLVCFHGPPSVELTESPTEVYNRWVRAFLGVSGKRSTRGALYEIDLRLRPWGRNSPQVTTLDSLESYFQEKAWFWERMAFSRARPLLGADRWRAAFEEWRTRAIFGPGFSAENREDLVNMRARIEQQKGDQVIKAGPGGLIDVEFASQAVALTFGANRPRLRSGETCHVLLIAADLGLIDSTTALSLAKGYLFLRDVENRIRLVKHTSLDRLPTDEIELDALARRVFSKDVRDRTGRYLTERLDAVTRSLRENYSRLLDSLI